MSESHNSLYNPLAIASIAESLVRKIADTPCEPLPPIQPFLGAGVYMLYYRGHAPGYEMLANLNQHACVKPIYVGKAVPKGGRIGVAWNNETGQELYVRLSEHADSIRAAENLELADFTCRYLATEHLFITLAEHTLITLYKPVWNYYGGFGNHAPGSGRRNQKRSAWDIVHPGRAWEAPLKDNKYGAEHWRLQFREHIDNVEHGMVPPIVFEEDTPTERNTDE